VVACTADSFHAEVAPHKSVEADAGTVALVLLRGPELVLAVVLLGTRW